MSRDIEYERAKNYSRFHRKKAERNLTQKRVELNLN